jgi:hypothetical protein
MPWIDHNMGGTRLRQRRPPETTKQKVRGCGWWLAIFLCLPFDTVPFSSPMTYLLMVENRRFFNCLMDWSVIVCCVFVPVGFFDCGSFDFMRQAGNSNISCTVLLLARRTLSKPEQQTF